MNVKPGDLVYIEADHQLEGDEAELGVYIRHWEMHPGYWRHEVYWFAVQQTSNESDEGLLKHRKSFLTMVKNEAA